MFISNIALLFVSIFGADLSYVILGVVIRLINTKEKPTKTATKTMNAILQGLLKNWTNFEFLGFSCLFSFFIIFSPLVLLL